MILTKNGIVFDEGRRVFSWTQFVNVLKSNLDPTMVKKIVKRLNECSEFDEMKMDQEMDLERLNEYAAKLGLKPLPTVKAAKSAITRKISRLKCSEDQEIESFRS